MNCSAHHPRMRQIFIFVRHQDDGEAGTPHHCTVVRLWALFEFFGSAKEKHPCSLQRRPAIHSRSYDSSYSPKTLFFVQHLSPTVSTALRAFSQYFCQEGRTTVLSSQLYSKAVKDNGERSTRVERWETRPGTRSDDCTVQERGQVGNHFRTTGNVKKCSPDSESELAAISVPSSVKARPMVSSSDSPDTSQPDWSKLQGATSESTSARALC